MISMRMKIRYLVISDLQVPYHHEAAVKNVIKLARREKFDSVLVVGDEIDFQTISRWAEKTPLACAIQVSVPTHRSLIPQYQLIESLVSQSV